MRTDTQSNKYAALNIVMCGHILWGYESDHCNNGIYHDYLKDGHVLGAISHLDDFYSELIWN